MRTWPKMALSMRKCQSFSLAQWLQTFPQLCSSQQPTRSMRGNPACQPFRLCRQLLWQAQLSRNPAPEKEEEGGVVSRALCWPITLPQGLKLPERHKQ